MNKLVGLLASLPFLLMLVGAFCGGMLVEARKHMRWWQDGFDSAREIYHDSPT